jgi:hypothetical protein
MRWIFLFILAAFTTIGCASNCQNVQMELNTCQTTLSDQDFIIKKQESAMRQKDQKIAEQQETIENMGTDIAELNRQLNIITTEKGRYDERIRDIAASVREFIKQQMRDNRNFLTNIALEDFIGNELIEIAHADDEKMIIINVTHPVPSGGQINGIGGYFTGPADIVVKLLRPVGNDYVVIYSKQLRVEPEAPGKKYVDFDSPFIVKKGDVLAYYFPGPVNVPYDSNIGTNTYSKMRSDQYGHGDRIAAANIWQNEEINRKYSLNYYGIFYTRVDSE